MEHATSIAWQDISSSFRMFPVWLKLGLNDMRKRYRRTVLGPWWHSLVMAITIAGLGFVWGTIFKIDLTAFFPYIASGLISWQLIASGLTEGCNVFTDQSAIIKSLRVPLTVHALRSATRIFINYLHNLPVYLIVALIFSVDFNWSTLLLVPGSIIIFLNLIWIGIVFGILGTRFRDVSALLGALLIIIFLLSPVVWDVSMLGNRAIIAEVNPLTYYLDLLRSPMLGRAPGTATIIVVGTITVVGWITAFFMFRRYRNRIVYWL